MFMYSPFSSSQAHPTNLPVLDVKSQEEEEEEEEEDRERNIGTMTKKALASEKPGLSRRHALCLGWRLAVVLSVLLCVLGFFRIQHYSQATGSSISTSLPRRSRVMGNPKIAFLFLVRRNLPLDFLWESFFENVDKANFSIYIHSEPGFVFDESTTRSAFLFNRQLRNSIKVSWGEASMIEAERLLVEEALQDPANQRFVLLSDSCIPLYNFNYIYSYLMKSPRSFVDRLVEQLNNFLDKNDVRYNPMMSPAISKKNWRKGSQWVALVRKHAEVVVADEIVFPVFKKFCKRRPPVDASIGRKSPILQKQHNCIPDEHFVQTLLAMNDLETELERRTVTYSLWNKYMANKDPEAWHPFTFGYADSGPRQIKRLRDINHVFYETELRTEWCKNNSTSVPCFLFARKFSQGAAMRLLSQGLLSNFYIFEGLKPP